MLEHKINELGLKFILYGYLNEYTKNCENKRSVLFFTQILYFDNVKQPEIHLDSYNQIS